MKVNLDFDQRYEDTTITIQSKEMNESIKRILDFLGEREKEFIIGKNGDMQHILNPEDVHYFYSEADTVKVVTSKGTFQIKEKLYELEETLPYTKFIRLSKSVIANVYELSRFEPSFNGTLCVYFKSGAKEYVSRHYVPKLKEILKINRGRKNK
ncbi:LytTR family DNA-binding domain-containing protein [Gracilibacillus sp. YIM 98692]|uniref:LytTR family DNA-binding domain-containing protein n=1 Tax=Gracilibacillus sp. YIM 98692 TaxID=2663532 RepID=UPI0013D07444|nr:LytTR family DNA-binding domain-containing protein [Gracilibacillus sp. YIM 98692]